MSENLWVTRIVKNEDKKNSANKSKNNRKRGIKKLRKVIKKIFFLT